MFSDSKCQEITLESSTHYQQQNSVSLLIALITSSSCYVDSTHYKRIFIINKYKACDDKGDRRWVVKIFLILNSFLLRGKCIAQAKYDDGNDDCDGKDDKQNV